MANHWPIAVFVLVILGAIGAGTYFRDQLIEAAAARPAANAATQSVAPVAPPATAPPAVAPAVVQTPAVAQPTVNPPSAVPKAVVAAPVAQATPATPAAPAPVNPVPAAAAAVQGPPLDPVVAQVFAELRTALQPKVGAAPALNATGGFNLKVDGARMDVVGAANWNISIYNDNKQAPQTETPNFTACLTTTMQTLKIENSPQPTEMPNGKKVFKSSSRVGRVSVTRDPANGNSCLIRPVQKAAAPAANAGATPPAKPATAQPPTPPSNEPSF